MLLTLQGNILFTAAHALPFGTMCTVSIYEAEVAPHYTSTVVILTQLPSKIGGRSVTNSIEDIAEEIYSLQRGRRGLAGDIDRDYPITWIQHHLPTVSVSGNEEFCIVTMQRSVADNSFSCTSWGKDMPREEVEALIGCKFEV